MSNVVFKKEDFKKRVPKAILKRTKENMEVYNMTLYDSFKEAVKELVKEGTDLWNAWYYDDFREYIPCVYEEQYLDFKKYPLKYKSKAAEIKRLYLTITKEQRKELKEHFKMNGYSVEWETEDTIKVDMEEIDYIKTILYDRYIPFTDDANEQWFGSRKIKKKIDTIYNIAREVWDMVEDFAELSDEEAEILNGMKNIVNAYENNIK